MIRKAEEADIVHIHALCGELEACDFPCEPFAEICRDILHDGSHVILVYEEEGTVCGFLHMRMEYQLHHCARIAEILELDVAENMRSQGIGRQLFQAACSLAAEEKCVQINLVSSTGRKDAHRFYETKGMVRTHYGFTMPL